MPTQSQLLNPNFYLPLLFNAVRIAFILLFAYLCAKAVGRLLKTLRSYIVKMMLKAGGETEYELEKRVQTISGVARKALHVVIWTIAAIMILKEMNFDIRPLLAGAGIGRCGGWIRSTKCRQGRAERNIPAGGESASRA